MTEIFLFEFKLYVYFKINIMVNFGILLHTLYIECNMHLLASLCNIGAKSANMRVSQGGRGSKMYAHLLSRGTNSIVDNIVVQMSLNTN